MGFLSGFFGKKNSFKPMEFEETQMNIVNPSRGWYKVYNFRIDEEPDFKAVKADMKNSDTLALVLIDIGACKRERIPDERISWIEKIIRFFSENGKELILRIAYDHTGNAMEREPSFFDHVIEHTEQVAEIIHKYSADIFVYQGILVGNWGEMHGSRYLEYDKMKKLEEILEKNCPKDVFLAVRKPSQWRSIKNIKIDGSLPEPGRLGLFNDGMFGSENDLGTYGTGNRAESGWSSGWSRNAELEFQNKLCRYVPNGGEALYGESFISIANEGRFTDELTVMHATYLNREHDPRLLDYWRNTTYKGKGTWKGSTLYDYIGAHLGYRFVVRKTEVVKTNSTEYKIRIFIENTGFSDIYRPCTLTLEYVGKDGLMKFSPDFDLRNCHPGVITECCAVIVPCQGPVYLSAHQKKDNRPIVFANAGLADGRVRLGEFPG